MSEIKPGRFTAQIEGSFVVFMIGMRVNRLRDFSKWLPTARAMGPMLETLYKHPEKGFLGGQTFFYWRGIALMQFWRSFDDLEHFARSKEEPHLSAWQRFNKNIGGDGSVGIWHETYAVEAGRYEAIYANMPVFGLAQATSHVSILANQKTARRRILRDQSSSEAVLPDGTLQ